MQGDRGPSGTRGLKGDSGDPLEVDVQLENVVLKDPYGEIGACGEKVDNGDTGGIGQQGPIGPRGSTSPRGVQGAKGLCGVAGIQGYVELLVFRVMWSCWYARFFWRARKAIADQKDTMVPKVLLEKKAIMVNEVNVV